MAEKPHTGEDDAFESERPVDDGDALIPVEDEPREAPPFDVDERTDEDHGDEAIAMPGSDDEAEPAKPRWHSTIDELLPAPQDEPYHDDDAAEEDPFDARDDVDMHVPPATGDAAGEVDDFSTGEELDVDNAPAGRNPEHDDLDPEDRDAGSEPPSGMDTTMAAMVHGETIEAASSSRTTCPTCGQETDALRFCGHCGAPLTESRHEVTGDTTVERLISRAQGYLEPLAHWSRPGGVRVILAIGAVLVLLSLLLNSGAMALIVGASIVPAIVLYWCRQIDVFENEPWYIVAGFAILGIVLGALLGWLGAVTATGAWFDEGVLNYGAAGFGGRFAEEAGTAPFLVWLVCGIVVPVLALAAIIAGPLMMRQTMSLRNEIMDGLTLAAAMGGGFAIGTAIVFVAPMFNQPGPGISASAWTLTTIGITILRPLIWTLSGAMLGAAAWRYLLSGTLSSSILPTMVAGIGSPLLATLLAIQVAPVGLWAEILLAIVITIAAGFLYQRTVSEAILDDRRVLGNNDSRLVCPNCHRVTPAGAFCSHCGETLGVMAQA